MLSMLEWEKTSDWANSGIKWNGAKFHTIWRLENFAFHSLLAIFPPLWIFRRFVNQLFDAMNSHHFDKASNKRQIELNNYRVF